MIYTAVYNSIIRKKCITPIKYHYQCLELIVST